MRHYGDITKLSGYELPVVDVITGGSPCQDLSVAGKRAGLAGERSGLFMEQMRTVKEMRERDRNAGRTAWAVRPRYMVWENVPGAFSSGNPKGADFAAVIEEIIKVAEPDASVRVCVPDGGWAKSGCYYAADGSWSVAWRVHDAQFWGVPQRRKRIALVADFGGLSAPEILFERKGLSRDSEPGEAARESPADGATSGAAYSIQGNTIDRAAKQNGSGISENVAHTLNSVDRHGVVCLNDQGGSVMDVSEEKSGTLRAQDHGHQPIVLGFKSGQGAKAGGIGAQTECSPTLSAVASGTNQVPAVYDARGNGNGRLSPTLTGDHESRVTDYTAICCTCMDIGFFTSHEEQAGTLLARQYKDPPAVMCGPLGTQNPIVRRLTPIECERLQGYPDGWTDIGDWTDSKGKKHKDADSPRYKALGNSIALPFWERLARRICAQYERPVTLGSLFDGIGGFPLAFERAGAKAVWASEIEEFPIAVTKKHFPEKKEGKA